MSEALRVGIAGLGTVGASVVRVLADKAAELTRQCGRPVVVAAVSARDKGRDRGVDLSQAVWFDDPVELATSNGIDVFVELIGGDEGPARACVEAALRAGRHVVTANKALLARHGLELAAIAEKNGVLLNYEAAVAGGIPVIKTMREALAGNTVSRVFGILNGTCNYILTRMEQEGLSFAECLKDAQRLGYAEANPSFDVDGHDTAQKLAILASLAFGTEVAQRAVYVEGISSITPQDLRAAEELGYRIKLLGVAVRTRTGIEQRVHPTMVPRTSSVAQVMGVTNAVTIDGAGISPITLVGPGAGGAATASAVVADIADVARGVRALPFGRPVARLKSTKKAPMERHEGGYYIRLMARDLAGTAATIATRLAERGISIESIVQRHPDRSGDHKISGKASSPVPVILITYATSEDAMRGALQAVQRDKVISGRPQVIRIEKN